MIAPDERLFRGLVRRIPSLKLLRSSGQSLDFPLEGRLCHLMIPELLT